MGGGRCRSAGHWPGSSIAGGVAVAVAVAVELELEVRTVVDEVMAATAATAASGLSVRRMSVLGRNLRGVW